MNFNFCKVFANICKLLFQNCRRHDPGLGQCCSADERPGKDEGGRQGSKFCKVRIMVIALMTSLGLSTLL